MKTNSGAGSVLPAQPAAKRPADLEETLATGVRTKQQELWLAENQEAIAAYNEHVAQSGIWSDGRRGF